MFLARWRDAQPAGDRRTTRATANDIRRAAELLLATRRPALFIGWARAMPARRPVPSPNFQAPVATTLQSLRCSPPPIRCTPVFGAAAVPATPAFADCGYLLAGNRFAEIATGSPSVTMPPN